MKIRLKIVVALAMGVGTLAVGSTFVCHRLTAWRQTRWLRQAELGLQSGHPRNASLALENALRHNPNDIKACRLMASLAENSRLPAALAWRSRALEIEPGSLDDRIAFARTALIFGHPDLAANALKDATALDRQTFGYLNTAGLVAVALNDPAQAAADFSKASRLEPRNEAPQFNLAIVHLQATDLALRDAAKSRLEGISTNTADPELRAEALRELARDALRHDSATDALEKTECLLRETNSVWADRLLRLEALKQAADPGFLAALSAVRQEASLNSGRVYQCATWQMDKLSPRDALSWLRSLPLDLQTNQPAALLSAQCLAQMQDWRGLHDSIEPENWDEWEFVRHAFMALALRGRNLNLGAETEWAAALKTAASRPIRLYILFRLSTQWNWSHERETVLSTVIDAFPDQRWAVDELSQSLFQAGDTRALMRLWEQERKRSPSSLTVANNLALAALLLDAKELNAHELADEVYHQAPTNAYYASTYAFSLYLKGKYAEALAVMNHLNPDALDNPAVAGYYGLLLKATDHDSTAQLYLRKASTARLLPEERKIFEQARASAPANGPRFP